MSKNTIYFAKVRPNAIIPSKKDEDAGYDIYACFDEDSMVIEPFTSSLIPTGLASVISKKYFVLLEERGSTGVKNMKRSAGIIDSGFRNEWMVVLYNANEKPIVITKETNPNTLKILQDDYIVYPYTKAICQALVLPVPEINIKEITYEEVLNFKSDRMLGMLGSSGK